MRKIKWWHQVLTQLILIVVAAYVILPIWGVGRLAFDGSLTSRPTEFRLLPKEFSMNSFLEVLDKPYQSVSFLTLFKNSMIVSVSAAFLAFILGASLAFAESLASAGSYLLIDRDRFNVFGLQVSIRAGFS